MEELVSKERVKFQSTCDCGTCPTRFMNLFHSLPPEALEVFNRSKVVNFYKKGQLLFYEGSKPLGVYCINSGRVKLYKTGEDGKQHILRIYGKGEILGLASIFAGRDYTTSAEAIEDSVICFIEKSGFFPFLSRYPNLALEVIRNLSQEVMTEEEQIQVLALKTADQRLAQLLLMLKETFGHPENSHIVLSLPLSRKEMAEMIGTTPETVIRLLKQFEKRGFVEIRGRRIVILDTEALIVASALEV